MAEAAKQLTSLEKEDLRILMAIERGMRRSEYVTPSNIKFYARYPMEETLFRVKKVHKQNLIMRDSSFSKSEVGYTLNSIGYDVLALHTLVQRDIISQLGPILGKGKESDVYSCMDDNGNIMALKIYRMGRTSFKNIKKLRDFVGERSHLSWLYVNRLAAKREFEALTKIYRPKRKTPKPIAFNRHIVVMSYLKGKELAYFQQIKKPEKVFNKIIKQMKWVYQNANMIHGDLGEFNIVLDERGEILIIDWLQWVPSEHPNAKALLERDITNVSIFFKKKYNIESNPQAIVNSFLAK